MKHIYLLTAGLLMTGSLFLNSCKRGDGDPFLSLRSRKARVAGEWKVASGSGSTVQTSGSTTQTTNWTYDGATYTETTGASVTTYSQTIEYSFDKEGAYSSVTTKVFGSATTTTITITEKGKWNFTSGVGDKKNKSQLVLRAEEVTTSTTVNSTTTTSTNNYSGQDSPTSIFDLYELKNKSIVMKHDGSNQDNVNNISTTKTEEIKLEAK